MGSYAALAVARIDSDCFLCREQPAPPYGGGRPPRARLSVARPMPSPALLDPPVIARPSASRPVDALHAWQAEREIRLADGLALALRAALDRIVTPLARAVAAFAGAEDWSAFGYARLEDHARERFGRSGRWLRDLALLGRALERLPGLGAALTGEDGGRPIGRVAAGVVARVADAASLAGWIERARSVTVRELRAEARQARARQAGSLQTDRASSPSDDLDVADRVMVRIPLPATIRAAFDEGLDLFRAVEGREGSATSFVEALVAECLAGPHSFATTEEHGAASARTTSAIVETALARSTGRWRHLPSPGAASPAGPRTEDRANGPAPGGPVPAVFGAAASALERLARMSGAIGSRAVDRDRQIRRLIDLEDELEACLGGLLADMAERGAWERLRFAGVGHYAEERLGLSRSTGEDRARAARALRRFRLLREAYDSGRIGLQAVLLVARLLGDGAPGDGCERAWVTRAREATIKRLRDEARALGLRRCAGGAPAGFSAGPRPMPDAEWHAALWRDRGRSSERIARLGVAALGGSAADFGVPDPSIGVPSGPDVFLSLRLPAPLAADFAAAIESRRRALEALAGSIPWDESWPDRDAATSLLAARMFSIRCRRVPSWVGLLALLEDFASTWDAVDGPPARPQDVVFVRDGWRCAAPGCTSRRNLEDHHLLYRSRGGGDEPSNRITLCRFHHQRGEHGGLASCSGRAPLGVVWRLGRDGVGGRFLNERRMPAGVEAALT